MTQSYKNTLRQYSILSALKDRREPTYSTRQPHYLALHLCRRTDVSTAAGAAATAWKQATAPRMWAIGRAASVARSTRTYLFTVHSYKNIARL
jgi:hypothetical protein